MTGCSARWETGLQAPALESSWFIKRDSGITQATGAAKENGWTDVWKMVKDEKILLLLFGKRKISQCDKHFGIWSNFLDHWFGRALVQQINILSLKGDNWILTLIFSGTKHRHGLLRKSLYIVHCGNNCHSVNIEHNTCVARIISVLHWGELFFFSF